MPTDQPNDTLGEPLESGHDELVGEGTKGHRKVKQAELCVGKHVGDERGECLQPFKDEPGSPLRTELKWPPRYASITHNFPCLAPQAEEWRGACRRLFACGRNAASAAGSWKLPPDVKLSTTRDLARCDRACVAPLSALSLYLRLPPLYI